MGYLRRDFLKATGILGTGAWGAACKNGVDRTECDQRWSP